MIRSVATLSVLLLATLLGACGPVYETRFELTPPAQSQNSAACIAGCEVQRSACIQRADEQFAFCRSQAQMEAIRCNSYRRGGTLWNDDPFGCDVMMCWNDRGACEAGFQACYTGCGGKVTARQVCVERCPDEPAAEAAAPAAQNGSAGGG